MTARPGRPLRAFAGLGLATGLWLALRVPAMQREVVTLAALARAPQPGVMQLAVRPPVPLPSPLLPLLQAARAPAPPLIRLQPPPPERPPMAPAIVPPAERAAPPAPATAPIRPASTPSPPASILPPPATDPAFALASAAYDQLRAGRRRQAARLFDAALALQPGNRQWQADRRALGRRWHGEIWSLGREGGPLPNQPGSGLPGFAASPVLGGGQLGASLSWTVNPLARRPLALVARANAAVDATGLRAETAQLAIGVRQQILPGVSLSIERLVPIGSESAGAFTARLAAGGRWRRLEAYGEAGALDTGQLYAGGQAHARLLRIGPATLAAGSWASIQTGSPDVWRVDVGPALSMKIRGIRLEADWRQRVAGNAAPGSGPAVTVSAGF